ncbi:TPA: HipA N-terminal domain-containing protein [Escherichia coli]|uniref:HipA N-terminal domain-containing protein n=1 Tax=Escherichia coli TaxID=562 RepID=UPI0002CAF90C|nr:HipA N-terminal domain-containing protein [Escherichia coli]EEW0420002.1 type II toxin-antitoxin system HipA family toxin [Escherichia coli]EEX9685864.1 type II toxin-antitoxin system HipA family toxin [Escherichia coli]EEZ4662507.1 type II toxin-antitoxin system HipA family toxin [Escherichia coli]EFO2260403.1 type II toxin-antitoxin system HipA family toxin [Escherichia coli]EGJ7894319.1 type II toxin-antitoxin system HipA family toxin [Escherichia coli]
MPKLVTWMNNQRVGELTKLANGAHTFKYAPEWLASRYARPLSLSLPLQRGNITSDAVFNFFDNLLLISAFPVLGGTGIHISDLKLAMGLNASKGKKTAIDKIYPRHFLATAKVLRFPEVQMHEILSDFARMIPAALDNVKTSLPTDFPENVVTAVETNVLRLHGRLSREYGSK